MRPKKVRTMSYLDDQDSLKSRITANPFVARVIEWWSYNSAFVIIPLAVSAFVGAAYLMFRDVI
jgi:hypothetical protein